MTSLLTFSTQQEAQSFLKQLRRRFDHEGGPVFSMTAHTDRYNTNVIYRNAKFDPSRSDCVDAFVAGWDACRRWARLAARNGRQGVGKP